MNRCTHAHRQTDVAVLQAICLEANLSQILCYNNRPWQELGLENLIYLAKIKQMCRVRHIPSPQSRAEERGWKRAGRNIEKQSTAEYHLPTAPENYALTSHYDLPFSIKWEDVTQTVISSRFFALHSALLTTNEFLFTFVLLKIIIRLLDY